MPSQSSDSVTIRGQTNELDGFTIKVQTNTRSKPAILSTLTDVFQLDKIHENILTKLKTNSHEQPYLLLDKQPFKDFEQ